MRQPKLYIIPGMGEDTSMKNYLGIITSAKERGLKVVPVKVLWSEDGDVTDFIKEADKQIPDNSENDYVIGFSMGAYIMSVLSKKKKIKGYIFCSTSPYFKDNLKKVPKDTGEYFGAKMMKSFSKYSISVGAKSNAWFMVGDIDWKICVDTTKKLYKKWKGDKKLFVIKGAGHGLRHRKYAKEIRVILEGV